MDKLTEYFLSVFRNVGDEDISALSPQFWFEFCKFVAQFGSKDLVDEAYQAAQKTLFLNGNHLDCQGKFYYFLVDYFLGLKKSDISLLLENHIESAIYSLSDEQLIDMCLDFINVQIAEKASAMER